mmetsp:Transcript_41860/g.110330  ORF Transcript_41860/g.110330 Transcript_41860/m.110330 type:complete len:262 (-) Transcript_41860:525-1310(-)
MPAFVISPMHPEIPRTRARAPASLPKPSQSLSNRLSSPPRLRKGAAAGRSTYTRSQGPSDSPDTVPPTATPNRPRAHPPPGARAGREGRARSPLLPCAAPKSGRRAVVHSALVCLAAARLRRRHGRAVNVELGTADGRTAAIALDEDAPHVQVDAAVVGGALQVPARLAAREQAPVADGTRRVWSRGFPAVLPPMLEPRGVHDEPRATLLYLSRVELLDLVALSLKGQPLVLVDRRALPTLNKLCNGRAGASSDAIPLGEL